MKRILVLLLGMVLLLALAGCSGVTRQEALRIYVEGDMPRLSELESRFMESYVSVSGENYTDDKAMHKEFTETTLVLAKQLHDAAKEVSQTISDKELLKVHQLYVESALHYVDGVTAVIAALEKQDSSQITTANEKISTANSLGTEFQSKIRALAEEHGVALE